MSRPFSLKNNSSYLFEGWICSNITAKDSEFVTCRYWWLDDTSEYVYVTPTRIFSINRLKISSLEIDIFGQKITVKSSLEFFILKFTKPLQSCKNICPERLNWRAWQVSKYLWRGWVNLKDNSRPLFTIIFKSKMVILKMVISRLDILVHFLKEF